MQGYYPFGGTFNEWTNTSPENQYLYNQGTGNTKFAVERQVELNLDFTKRRLYDYNLGRFTSIDPLADQLGQERWNPYHYGLNNPLRYNDPYGEGPGDRVLGFFAAIVDNATGGLTNVRGAAANYVSEDGAADFNSGQDAGDVSSLLISAALIDGGTAGTVGGVVVSATGVGAVVGAPVAAVSVGLIAEGAVIGVNAANNLATQKGRLKIESRSASDKKLINDAKTNPSNNKTHDTNQGPSGKKKVHTVRHSSKKAAKDAARQGGKGTPVKHTKDAKGGKHFHHGNGKVGKGKGTKNYGGKAGKVSDNVHHEYSGNN